MPTLLERRLKVLEDASGSGGCPRCSGVMVTYVCGKFDKASKHGKEMTEAEYRAFTAEEDEDDRCPVCRARRFNIKVPTG